MRFQEHANIVATFQSSSICMVKETRQSWDCCEHNHQAGEYRNDSAGGVLERCIWSHHLAAAPFTSIRPTHRHLSCHSTYSNDSDSETKPRRTMVFSSLTILSTEEGRMTVAWYSGILSWLKWHEKGRFTHQKAVSDISVELNTAIRRRPTSSGSCWCSADLS